MTVSARRPEDQQYQKCVDQKCVDALDRLHQHITATGYAVHQEDLATVRDTLERQQSRIYILENMRSENYIEALESAEAEVRRLTEGLREARRDIDNVGRWAAHPNDPTPRDWALVVRECEQSVARIDALLSANPPQGDAAEGSSPSAGDEGREGMITAYDHRGRYVGCIGEQTWRWLIDHPEVDAPALLRAFEMFSPSDGGGPSDWLATTTKPDDSIVDATGGGGAK